MGDDIPERPEIVRAAKALHLEMRRLDLAVESVDWDALNEGARHVYYLLAEVAKIALEQ